jgi:hypothetical protein
MLPSVESMREFLTPVSSLVRLVALPRGTAQRHHDSHGGSGMQFVACTERVFPPHHLPAVVEPGGVLVDYVRERILHLEQGRGNFPLLDKNIRCGDCPRLLSLQEQRSEQKPWRQLLVVPKKRDSRNLSSTRPADLTGTVRLSALQSGGSQKAWTL